MSDEHEKYWTQCYGQRHPKKKKMMYRGDSKWFVGKRLVACGYIKLNTPLLLWQIEQSIKEPATKYVENSKIKQRKPHGVNQYVRLQSELDVDEFMVYMPWTN